MYTIDFLLNRLSSGWASHRSLCLQHVLQPLKRLKCAFCICCPDIKNLQNKDESCLKVPPGAIKTIFDADENVLGL